MQTQLNTSDLIHHTGLQLNDVMDDLDVIEAHGATLELRAFATSINRRLADAMATILLLPEARQLRAVLVAKLDQLQAELAHAETNDAALPCYGS